MSTTREHESLPSPVELPGVRSFGVADERLVKQILQELQENGIATLPSILTRDELKRMQSAFRNRLKGLQWNNYDGFEKTEPQRHMVEDVLVLDPGFLKAALHPLVKQVLKLYLGDRFELVEAKGWKSLPTKRDFHGWHGDAWYEQEGAADIPKEVKLAIYLTDVESGAFNFINGSHRQHHPRPIRTSELGDVKASDIVELLGEAGTAFLFDTSGVHRQGVPILEPREAVFLNYHDPEVPLQREDRAFYRYHPLLLNAAFLGDLSSEDQMILGFGNLKNFVPSFVQADRHPSLHRLAGLALDATLQLEHLAERMKARWRLLKRN